MMTIETAAPAAPSEPQLPPLVPYPTLKESWGFVGWYLLITLVGGIGLMALLMLVLSRGHQQPPTQILIVLCDLLLLGFLYWRYGRRWVPLQLLGQAPGWLYALLPLLTVAAILVLSLLDFLALPNWAQTMFERMAQQPVQLLLLGGIVIPVLEEVLFRGVLLQGLLRNKRPWVAIGQQALLFGLIHVNPAQSLSAFLIGLLLGWLCYRTGSLLPGIGIHVLNNLGALGLIIWLPDVANSRTNLPELLGSNWAYAGLVALAAVVLMGLLWRVSLLALPAAWASVPNSPEPDLES